MTGKTHLVTGCTAGAGVAALGHAVGAGAAQCVILGVICAYAALLPDLDHPRATVTRSLGPVTWFPCWVLRGCPVDLWWWEFRLWNGVRHRGFTHRPAGWVTFGVIAGVAVWFLPAWVPLGAFGTAVSVIVGCATHSWGDMRTTAGLYLAGRQRWIGRTFDVDGARDSRETWLRHRVYVPTATAAWVAAVLYMGGGVSGATF